MRRLLEKWTGLVLQFLAGAFVIIFMATLAVSSHGTKADPRDAVDRTDMASGPIFARRKEWNDHKRG